MDAEQGGNREGITRRSAGTASVEHLTELLDLVPGAVIEVTVHPDGRREITHFSAGAVELYGHSRAEALGVDPAALLGDLPRLDAPVRARRRIPAPPRWQGEFHQRARDGRALRVLMRVSPRLDDDGETQRNLIAIRDLTAEREWTGRLAERSALLALAPDAIFVCGLDRRITYWNRGAERAYGFTRSEALGRRPQDLLRTQYPIPLEEIERHVIRRGEWEGDLVQTTKHGREVTVGSRWGAVYATDGGTTAFVEINRDITDRLALAQERERATAKAERDRLAERLVRSQRLESLGELAGGIAHDFNNLLAVITGYNTVLTTTVNSFEGAVPAEALAEARDDLAQITSAAARAAQLTSQLLAFARQEQLEAQPVQINRVVADLRELLQRTLGEHIQIETALEPRLHHVLADEGQLGQVLVNLAVNSRDAMPDGGKLIIETANELVDAERAAQTADLRPGPYAALRVSDTGCGMPPEVLERAFDPFFTTKAVGEGTGLGLATAYGIIAQAGGHVGLYSEPGRGTTFTALLPATDEAVAPDASSPAVSGPRATAAFTILLVEDQPALRLITSRTLTRAGYRVIEAANGVEALEVAAALGEPIDLLLTDVVMPEMLGQQLALRLRQAQPSLRVVYVSGFARRSLELQGQPLDAPLLQKPFSLEDLLVQVARSLEQQ